jgi:predicted O-methyltransferase YrrM
MEYDFKNIWEKALFYNIEQKPEEIKMLLDFLNNTKNKRYALEIGSNYGGTAYSLCHLYDYVITIDIKHDENFDKIRTEFPNYNYIIADSNSADTINVIKKLGIKFDFIFIDGDHSYEGVKSDYENYKQFLASDGHMAFHDIVPTKENHENNIFVDKLWNELDDSYAEKFEFVAPVRTNVYRTDNLFHEILRNQRYEVWGGIGLLKNTQVSIFSHNFLDNNWKEIVDAQLNKMSFSGLYDRADTIFYGVYSNSDKSYSDFEKMVKSYDKRLKIDIVRYKENQAEYSTLLNLQNHCRLNPNSQVLYFHTKGSSREKSSSVTSWRECMEYFVLEKWRHSFYNLKDKKCDVCGALYVNVFRYLHYEFKNYFSGNFWWADSNYINKLPSLSLLKSQTTERSFNEMWIGMQPHVWINYYSENVTQWYEHYFNPETYKNSNFLN